MVELRLTDAQNVGCALDANKASSWFKYTQKSSAEKDVLKALFLKRPGGTVDKHKERIARELRGSWRTHAETGPCIFTVNRPNDGGRGVPQEKRLWCELQLSGWRPSIFRWTPEQSRKGDRGRERQMWRELHPMALWMAAGSSCDVGRGYKSYKHLSLSFPPEKGRFIIKKGFGASCN